MPPRTVRVRRVAPSLASLLGLDPIRGASSGSFLAPHHRHDRGALSEGEARLRTATTNASGSRPSPGCGGPPPTD